MDYCFYVHFSFLADFFCLEGYFSIRDLYLVSWYFCSFRKRSFIVSLTNFFIFWFCYSSSLVRISLLSASFLCKTIATFNSLWRGITMTLPRLFYVARWLLFQRCVFYGILKTLFYFILIFTSIIYNKLLSFHLYHF